MTVSTTNSSITYIGNGATTVWSFPFAISADSIISVFIKDPTGAITQQPTNAYTVAINPPITPNPTSIGGTVTFPLIGPPLSASFSIVIIRGLPETQLVSLSNQSIIYPPVVEQEFDRLVMLDQGISDILSRAPVAPFGDPPMAPLPPQSFRAGAVAVFDTNGNLTAGVGTGGAAVSSVMIPVVTATTLPLARAAMGVPPVDTPTFTGNPTAPTPAPGDNDTSLATTAFVQAALVAVGAAFTTGDLKPTHKTVADTGWVIWVDGTIGDATSGSSIRANADTSALFTLYYNNYSDSTCPLLNSGGTGVTRASQGVAAAAFANHCRMSLPKGSSRVLGLAGAGAGLSARSLGQTVGGETHTIIFNELPPTSAIWSGNNTGAVFGPSGSTTDIGLVRIVSDITGGNAPFSTVDPTTYINVMIKL